MKRNFIKLFFAVLVAVMALDATPWNVLPSDKPKELLGEVTNRAGIWQGQWMMFAPNPSVNNLWLTANVYSKDGTPQDGWTSPYWPTESGWKKFHHFRYMNFYNRLNLPQNRVAVQDFAEFLAEELATKHEYDSEIEIEMQSNSYQMISPEPGLLPSEDELVWVAKTVQLFDSREGEPPPAIDFVPLWPEAEAILEGSDD